MPSYSRDKTVATVTSYYEFLTSLYLPTSTVLYPPEGGWPEITKDSLAWLGKTDTVVDLLRHLPYIRREQSRAQDEPYQIYENTSAVDYRGSYYKYASESDSLYLVGPFEEQTILPAHAVTFATTSGSRDGYYIFLDTERGTVTLCDFQDGPKFTDLSQVGFEDSKEQWRRYATYSIRGFFKELKRQFSELEVFPSDRVQVQMTRRLGRFDVTGIMEIFRRHGWPSSLPWKDSCMEEVKLAWHTELGLEDWRIPPRIERFVPS